MSNQSFKDLIHGERPVLVDFFAEWCGPCKAMKPILDDFKGMVGEKAVVIKVDIDRNPAAAQAYGVQAVPTLVLFKNGQIVWRQSGVVPATQLQTVVQPYL